MLPTAALWRTRPQPWLAALDLVDRPGVAPGDARAAPWHRFGATLASGSLTSTGRHRAALVFHSYAALTLSQIASLTARVGLTPCGEKDETILLEVSEEMVKSAGCMDTRW